MKFTILKEKLKEGINTVERVSGKSLNLPILNNILISVDKNFLNLAATDLEIGINWWSLVKAEKNGSLAVPAKIISSFVNFLPNKPINVSLSDLTLNIEADNYQTALKGFGAEEFPIIPNPTDGESTTLKSKLFCQSLNQVVDIAGYFSTKPELSGIYFLFQKDTITMTATDSFRLGEKKMYLKSPLEISQDYSFILPQRAAKEIVNIFGEKEEELKIYFSPNQVLFEINSVEMKHSQIQLVSRLIEGEYPNYQEIIPKEIETKIFLPKTDFINQLKAAALFSGKVNEVKLKIEPKTGRVDVISQNPELGDHKSFLIVKAEGKPCEISFNHKFLIDGLLNMGQSAEKNQEILLELIGSERPGVMRLKNDNSYLYLVMPIKP